ncbi:hypothetical protein KI387_028355, partial [Taxus chinensis]
MDDITTEKEREERQIKYDEVHEREIDRQRGITSGLWSQTWWKGVEVHVKYVEPKQSVIPHL